VYRFDWIAGAIQKLTEEVLVKWIQRAIETTGIRNVCLGGGVFMNVKANSQIMYETPVEELRICPSAGDESTAIGSAYHGYKMLCEQNSIEFNPRPIPNLYLGPSYCEEEIGSAIEETGLRKKYIVESIEDMTDQVAGLLAKGKIVARFSGRMEFGARALGNRSILADPSNMEIVKVLNKQIKQRDFWMPFAPTILEERQHDYIQNPKQIEAPHMVLAFNTNRLAWKELRAALHPYDNTCRPQILNEHSNKEYYDLVKKFEAITGIGGILNTSFNLHGEPIVCSPKDAIQTFENSGLGYLALGNFLISK
jgi:carbamoyltransferase